MEKVYRPQEVWYARVKFEDKEEVVDRPALIIASNSGNPEVVILKITTTEREEDYHIQNKEYVRLNRESYIRWNKPLLLNESDLLNKKGLLHPEDWDAVKEHLKEKFGFVASSNAKEKEEETEETKGA